MKLTCLLLLGGVAGAFAQSPNWTLEFANHYAVQPNITLRGGEQLRKANWTFTSAATRRKPNPHSFISTAAAGRAEPKKADSTRFCRTWKWAGMW